MLPYQESPAREPNASAGASADVVSTEEIVGLGTGAIVGAAAGGIAGPVGLLVGAALGSIIGDLAGASVHDRAAEIATRTRASDDLGQEAMVTALRVDHDQLHTLAANVMGRVAGGDRDEVRAAIVDMQARVLAHLDGEERHLLVAYAIANPDDARELMREHAEIRRALAEFDVAVDLHLLRASATESFLVMLRAHAARENAGLYPWAVEAQRAAIDARSSVARQAPATLNDARLAILRQHTQIAQLADELETQAVAVVESGVHDSGQSKALNVALDLLATHLVRHLDYEEAHLPKWLPAPGVDRDSDTSVLRDHSAQRSHVAGVLRDRDVFADPRTVAREALAFVHRLRKDLGDEQLEVRSLR